MDIQKWLRTVLGKKARERVTLATGVITSINFDLYGCVQALLKPPVGEDGKQIPSAWWDIKRLVISTEPAVMHCPDFTVGPLEQMPDNGPENKPTP